MCLDAYIYILGCTLLLLTITSSKLEWLEILHFKACESITDAKAMLKSLVRYREKINSGRALNMASADKATMNGRCSVHVLKKGTTA